MGNENHKKISKEDIESNISVLDRSLESISPIFDDSSYDSGFEIITDFKEKEKTKTEEEPNESEEVIFDEIKDFVIVEGNAPPLTLTKIKKKKKSNNNKSLINAPRQKIKMVDDEFVAPLRIRLKTYGGSLRKKQILLFESENDKFDSKSCNDSENLENNCFDDTDFETEKEISIPKDVGDLKNLQDCRKRMTFFRDSISNKSDHSLNDEEKIEDIFSKLTNFSNKSSKKNKYWTKYIKQQKKEIKLSRKLSFGSLKIKNSSTFKKEIKNPYNDLFILGILEKAAKEKKQKKMAKNSENNVWS
jgi:hypothetical protein